MSQKKKRIGLSPSDEVYAVLSELAELTGQSRAGIAHELVEAALPALRMSVEAVKQYRATTSATEKEALQSVYAQAEKRLEYITSQIQGAASAATTGAGTGAGAGQGGGGADAGGARAGRADAGDGAGAGEQGGAQAYVDRRPGGFAVLRADGMAVDRPTVLGWFETEADALAFAASVNGGAHDGTAP